MGADRQRSRVSRRYRTRPYPQTNRMSSRKRCNRIVRTRAEYENGSLHRIASTVCLALSPDIYRTSRRRSCPSRGTAGTQSRHLANRDSTLLHSECNGTHPTHVVRRCPRGRNAYKGTDPTRGHGSVSRDTADIGIHPTHAESGDNACTCSDPSRARHLSRRHIPVPCTDSHSNDVPRQAEGNCISCSDTRIPPSGASHGDIGRIDRALTSYRNGRGFGKEETTNSLQKLLLSHRSQGPIPGNSPLAV